MKIKPTIKPDVIKQEWEFPPGFIMTIDTREQSPLFLPRPPKGLYIVRDTLGAGDYSVKGFESMVSIERKGLEDFYGSIGKDRDRFQRELVKLKSYTWAGLVIEGTEDQVLSAGYYTALTTEQIRQSLVSIELRYGISIYYAKDRVNAQRWILDRLLKFYILKRSGKL